MRCDTSPTIDENTVLSACQSIPFLHVRCDNEGTNKLRSAKWPIFGRILVVSLPAFSIVPAVRISKRTHNGSHLREATGSAFAGFLAAPIAEETLGFFIR